LTEKSFIQSADALQEKELLLRGVREQTPREKQVRKSRKTRSFEKGKGKGGKST